MGHGGCMDRRAIFLPLLAVLLSIATARFAGVTRAEDRPAAAEGTEEQPTPAAEQPAAAEEKPAPAAEQPAAVKPAAENPAAQKPAGANKLQVLKGQVQQRQIQIRVGGFARKQLRVNSNGELLDDDPVFFPADRPTLQRLSKAEELLEEERYGEAVRLLGDILEGPEDFFFQPDRDEPIHRSLKAEAQRLIGELPTAGRASYELQYGALARQKLDEALARGDADALAEVSRRFFHTKAGYEATRVLGDYYFDSAQPLAAALCLGRLAGVPDARDYQPTLAVKMASCWIRAGMPDKAQEALADLARDPSAKKLRLAGKEVPLFDNDADALEWLSRNVSLTTDEPTGADDQWPMYRGNPMRNAASAGSSPLLSRRWAVKTSDTFGKPVEDLVTELRAEAADQGQVILSSMHPLAVDNLVFMRTIGGLLAIDFSTGKRLWPGPVNESIRQLIDPTAAPGNMPQIGRFNIRGGMIISRGFNHKQWLSHRLWEDATYGTLSSDGAHVFCIEDLDEGLVPIERRIVPPNGRALPQSFPRTYNRLAAYAIATEGKLSWEIGGPPVDTPEEFAGAYFLGPPLPLAGSVYAIAEHKGEIRLAALDAATGKPIWSQQLAVLDMSPSAEQNRHGSGVSPSYSDGVLVCPTSVGAVVALDLTTRSLLWGYQYPRTDFADLPSIRIRNAQVLSTALMADRWCDSSVMIAGGCVLLTPPESNQIHCLNLLDGTLLWQKPREDGLYVGCVEGNKVLIVGRNSVRALSLNDGEPVWADTALPLPSGSGPSGRGFFNGNRYHLPLNSAEVAVIDIDAGRIVGRAKSRTGAAPGNLICHRGAVISQNADVLERFDQRDDLWQQINAALADNPADAAALARRGELLLDEGEYGKAIENLRQSFDIAADPHTRELLVDSLLEGLRSNFANYSDHLDDIEKLIDQPQQRSTYLRLIAVGWQSVDNLPAAFEAYLRIAAEDPESDVLERTESALSVRRDRWVRARLKSVLDEASPAERREMEHTLKARMQIASHAKGTDALRNFLTYFGSLPMAVSAREELAVRLVDNGSFINAEHQLLELQTSSEPRQAAAALARTAAMLAAAERFDDAAICYHLLGDRYADVECLDGKTGRQLVAAIAQASDLGRALQPSQPFPHGKVEREDTKGQTGAGHARVAFELLGSRGPYFEYMSAHFDPSQQALLGIDGYGRERWRVSLREALTQNNVNFVQLSGGSPCPARVCGHLMVVSLGHQVLGIDTLGGPGGDGARILWRHSIVDQTMNMSLQAQPNMIQVPWAGRRLVIVDALNRPLGNIGPLSPEIACYQRMRSVVAVRPLTGETLWTRSDIEPGSEIFGDDELLFVVAPDSEEALVLRALDGQEVGRRKVAPSMQRMTTIGRNVASWQLENGRAVLRFQDAWNDKEVWSRTFDVNAKAWIVGDECVGVMSRAGDFQLINWADGRLIIAERLKADPQMNEIYVLRSPDRYALVVSHPGRPRQGVNRQEQFGAPLITGDIYLFDRTSGKKVGAAHVDQQGLILNQPAALPTLVFMTNIYQLKGTSQTHECELVCLDKRDGRMLLDKRYERRMQSVEVIGDPDHHQIAMKLQGTGATLTFTGTPFSEKPKEEQPESDTTKAGKAVSRGLQNWFQSVTPPFVPPDED